MVIIDSSVAYGSDAWIGAIGSVVGGVVGAIGAFLCANWMLKKERKKEKDALTAKKKSLLAVIIAACDYNLSIETTVSGTPNPAKRMSDGFFVHAASVVDLYGIDATVIELLLCAITDLQLLNRQVEYAISNNLYPAGGGIPDNISEAGRGVAGSLNSLKSKAQDVLRAM